jgi:hypothetical protein
LKRPKQKEFIEREATSGYYLPNRLPVRSEHIPSGKCRRSILVSLTYNRRCHDVSNPIRYLLSSVLCLLLISAATIADEKSQKKKDSAELAKKVENLIKGLDDDDFKIREASEKQLIEIGKPAFNAVQKATRSKSPEVQFRAKRLLKKIPLVGKVLYIDLQPKANQKLDELFHLSKSQSVPNNNLSGTAKGEQVVGNVKFNIGKGSIQLASKKVKDQPAKVEGIRVNKTFKTLHLLHATGYGAGRYFVEDGTLIGKYILHYQGGKKVSLPIVYGTHVRDWWNWDNYKPIKDKNSSVAWTGSNEYAELNGVTLRLFRTAWKNPHPDNKVLLIDYISTNTTDAAPFCIAMSAELE